MVCGCRLWLWLPQIPAWGPSDRVTGSGSDRQHGLGQNPGHFPSPSDSAAVPSTVPNPIASPDAPSPGAAADRVDVLIVGGGVCGTALLFELARYTDLSRLALVERYGRLAQVNSRASSNSQTIHCGDIETNYTLEKALSVQRTAAMIGRYGELLDPAVRDRCVFRTPKMVLAAGGGRMRHAASPLRAVLAPFSGHGAAGA